MPKGLKAYNAAKSKIVIEALCKHNGQMWARLAETTIGGKYYPRPESEALLNSIQKSGMELVFVTGDAGSGKSGVILSSAKELEARGWTVLAIRADSSALDQAVFPQTMSTLLGLGNWPIGATLRSIAADKPAVLLIDQLDSVSLTYGRRSELYDAIKEEICEALQRQVKVVVGCRKFDIDNDHRIRLLASSKGSTCIAVEGFCENEVRDIIGDLGGNGISLSPAQIRLFSTPLHLGMLERTGFRSNISISTEKELFGAFWDAKQRQVRKRCAAMNWNGMIDQVLDGMVESNTLLAPRIVLSDSDPVHVQAMLSEQILVSDPTGYSFFHEKFFDYAFARRFSEKRGDLRTLIIESGQHLSVRGRVRQILLYRRSEDLSQYLKDLKWLLSDEAVRLHIKVLVLELMGQIDEVLPEEWRIVSALLTSNSDTLDLSSPVAAHAWKLAYLEPWFDSGHECGDIRTWLQSTDDNTIGQMINLLHWLDFENPVDIVEILEGFVGSTSEWNARIGQLFESRNLSKSRDLFEFYQRMMQSGILDGYFSERSDLRDFWGVTYSLAEEHPEWVCESVACYVRRGLEFAEFNGQKAPFGTHDGIFSNTSLDDKTLERCTEFAPQAVLNHLLPLVLEIVQRFADKTREGPWSDSVFVYRHVSEAYTFGEHILSVVEDALSQLAKTDPQNLHLLVSKFDYKYETILYLAIRAYTAAGGALADQAIDFVCDHPACFEVGYIDDHQYATRLLIEAVTPHCSSSQLNRFETLLLSYYPQWELKGGIEGFRGTYHGVSQLKLIEGIAEERRSAVTARRIAELRRKFADRLPKAPARIAMQEILSPVSASSADRLTDAQWLAGVKKYNSDEREWRVGKEGQLVGGALELSRQLEAQSKLRPDRFSRLALAMPDNTHKYYFDGILQGVTEANASIDSMIALVNRCHELPGRPCGKAICRLIEKKANLPWPDAVLVIVAWYAIEDPDPDKELWRTPAGPDGVAYYGGSIENAGLNCTRGSAANAVTKLLYEDEMRIGRFLPILGRMVSDPSIAVRSQVVRAIGPIWNQDKASAVDLYLRLCNTEDALLSTQFVLALMPYMLHLHFIELEPLLERMRNSSDVAVQKACGMMAVIAYLSTDDALILVERCLTGSSAHRTGLAKAFATNVGTARSRPKCLDGLKRLFMDGDAEVRKAAGACFTRFEDDELGSVVDLVSAYCQSGALLDDSFHILRALDKTTAKMPETSLRVFERFIEVHGRQVGDMRFSPSLHANQVSKLALRLYSQSTDEAIRQRCLDLIDKLYEFQVHGIDREVQGFEMT